MIGLGIILGAIIFFLFGTLIGSFLNVVILRYNTGAGLGGRSGCFSCGHILRWYELVPLLSYLALGGRCSACKSRISIQYPLVELVTALLFCFTFLHFLGAPLGRPLMMLFFAIESVLVVIFAYDIRHKIIPDAMSFAFAALSLVALVAQNGSALLSYPGYLDLLAGPLFFLPFYLLWKISDGKWIGLGDGKLAIGIGWMLGFASGVAAIVIGFWVGAIVCLAAMGYEKYFGKSKMLTMKTEIPFAPFLIIGIFAAFFFGFDPFGLHILLAL